jgi:hypothetical protein
VDVPEDLPVVRDRARPKGGRGLLALPEQARVPSQNIEWLFSFASRGGLDIEGLGYKTGIALIDLGLVTDPGDVFSLTADDLAQLPGFADKSITNLLSSIEAGRDRPIWRLLTALNIPHVGTHVAQVLANAFVSIDALMDASEQDIDDVEEIGPRDRPQRPRVVRRQGNRKLLEKLRAAGVRMKDQAPKKPRGKQPLAGKTIVLTGASRACRETRRRPRPRRPARAWPRVCRRRPTSSWSARTRARRRPGPRSSASRRSTSGVRQAPGPEVRAALRHLWHDARVPDEGDAMTAVVIDGNAIAEQLRQSIAEELQVLRLSEVRPGLATVLIGESFDAQAYEKHVKRLAESLEYRYVCERLPDDIELEDVVATLGKLNADPRITGILVLHPLPDHIPEAEMNSAVDPRKDIEAVHP